MEPDPVIKTHFEIADDSIQGLLGYYHYVANCHTLAPKDTVLAQFAETRIQITDSWSRKFRAADLCTTMEDIFEKYHCRTILVNLVSVFDATLLDFNKRLHALDKIKKEPKNYKSRLKWIFFNVVDKDDPTPGSPKSIYDICLEIDHVRRVRDLFVHHNGRVNSMYKNSTIKIPGHQPILYYGYDDNDVKAENISLLIPHDFLESAFYAHISLLHYVYNTVQKKFFGYEVPYEYIREHKGIGWARCLAPFRVD